MPRLQRAGLWAGLALMALAAVPRPAAALDVKAGDLVIEHPWCRATPAGAQVAGGYVTIRNAGTTPDRLLGGSFSGASGFEFHAMSTEGTVMRMRPTGPLAIPAAATLTLSPAGTHVMLKGLTHPLRKGEVVDGTLVFERAGTVPVRFAVEGIGARAAGEAPSAAGQAMPGMTMP